MDNLALTELAGLVGEWDVVLSNAEFLDADATLTGSTSITWLDGAFLVLRSSMEGGPPTSTEVIGRNEALPGYEAFYADERGVSRIFAMTYKDGVWIQHREDPGFHQRWEARVEADRITGTWFRSHDDGATWIHDFDLVYTRR